MSNKLATLLSILFHPIWFPFGLLLFYLWSNPITFGISEPFQDMVLVLQTLITSIVLPMVSMVVMWKVNLISSLNIDNRMERIGPYIVMMIFLIWYYLNIKQYGVAPIFRLYILGGIISLFLIFFVNLFMKVSLHMAGIAGVITNLLIAQQLFSYSSLYLYFRGNYYELNFQIITIIAFLILIIVLLSRSYLRKHTFIELLGGLVLGFFGQILAIRLIDLI